MNIPAVLLSLLFASCTTQAHVRDADPTRVALIQKDYQSLANCVVKRIEASGIAKNTRVTVDEGKKRIKVFEPFGFIHNTNTFEFLFIQAKETQTRVESYGFETLVGRDHYPNQIWPFVMECAEHPP